MTRFELATLTLGRSCPTIGPHPLLRALERVAGIEPAWPAWKAGTLPLSYTRALGAIIPSLHDLFVGHNRCMRLSAWLVIAALGGSFVLANASGTKPDSRKSKKTMQDQSVDPNFNETPQHRDARMKWWREARFGMFIHWGLYAVPAGTWNGVRTPSIGEWIMHDLKIPVADYAALAKQFSPDQFDADKWVGIAKAAGMKYIVMTAKHHEGFAMYHSKVDSYNIFDATPFQRDPIAEMSAACKKANIKFGVYYSQAQDWHHAGGAAYGGHWDTAQDGDLHDYVKKVAAPQVKELLTEYHPAVLWWDTPVDMTPEDIKALTAAFSTDPELIANNRLGNGVPGDTETPEQFVPATGYPGKDWETCMTMNDTWGYKSFDTNFKSVDMLLKNLIDIASKGGNYLLNVGPDATGVIPAPEVERLSAMGQWLDANGDSIYGTTASPFKKLPFDGRCTVNGNKLYLNVFTWPAEGLTLSGLKTAVKHASVVSGGQHLRVRKSRDGTISIAKPKSMDAISTAIVLELAGKPEVTEQEYVISALPSGGYKLDAIDAILRGNQIQVEHGEHGNIGFWFEQADTAEWKLKAAAAGKYSISLDYSCEPSSEGSTFDILVDGASSGITGTVAKTASWYEYKTMKLTGSINLAPGEHIIKIVPKTKPGQAVMNLKDVTLTPG